MSRRVTFRKTGRDISWARELIRLGWVSYGERVLQAVHQLGIFMRLGKGPAGAAAVAAELRLNPDMTEKLLIACAAMNLVRRDGGRWKLTPRAAATLLPDSPLYQGNMLNHGEQIRDRRNSLEAIARDRKGAWDSAPQVESNWSALVHRDSILSMHYMAMAGRAAELAERVDLRGKRTLMDIGGGSGTYAMALCARYPQLRATVFDLPETIPITREIVSRCGFAGRVSTVTGNWDTDEFGRGNDALMMSSILHGRQSKAEMKLEKAFHSMNSGAVLIVQTLLLNRGRTGPLLPALFNINMMDDAGEFSTDELFARIRAAGFGNIKRTVMPGDLGTTLITAIRP